MQIFFIFGMWALLFFLTLLLGFYIWYKKMRLKEEAFTLVTAAIQKRGYQLLDDAIGLAKIRLQRRGWRYALTHIYEFHYANEHQYRHTGYVTYDGRYWLNVVFHKVDLTTPQENHRKVIPFPGKYPHE